MPNKYVYEPIPVIVAQTYQEGEFLKATYPGMLDGADVVTSLAEAEGRRCTQLFVSTSVPLHWDVVDCLIRSMKMHRMANMFPIVLTVPKYWEAAEAVHYGGSQHP